ncbi:MAG: hypothetical protein V3U06_12460, partial [Candidatus Binatia bacterium]
LPLNNVDLLGRGTSRQHNTAQHEEAKKRLLHERSTLKISFVWYFRTEYSIKAKGLVACRTLGIVARN